MRRTNINAVLRMVREYLNGDMNEIDFYLDFPYEIEKRYQKMCREDPDYTDMIYYYLVKNGTDLHRSMTRVPSTFMRKFICRLRLNEVSRQ